MTDGKTIAQKAKITIAVRTAPFDVAAETASLRAGLEDIGAVVTFVGICRGEGGRLLALEIEHYPGMAEAEIGRIAETAAERWPVQAITVVHRAGNIEPGEEIVVVIAASAHRQAAFSAARFMMDFLKTDAPFWKKEHRAGSEATRWVTAKTSDDEAAARWRHAGDEDQ